MRHRGTLTSLALTLLLAAPALRAQRLEAGCDKEGTTSFRFGRTGGDLLPAATELTAAGEVRRRGVHTVGPVRGRVPRARVKALAQRAWRGGFGALPPAPRAPTGAPDAPRRFIELHTACGMRHVEVEAGAEPPLFTELFGTLTRLTTSATRTR